MEKKNDDLANNEEKNTLLIFLKRTKEGEYATIDKSSLPYSRFKVQREEIYYEDEYYYSLR